MPFGILECRKMEVVPGTALMNDQSDLPPELQDVPAERLKHGTGKFSHILLVPQPSDSPNDPLNWPMWKKDMVLLVVGFAAAVVGAYGPMLGPGFVPISKELGISVNTLSQATAWLILTLGLCVFLINPVAKMYGKRPVYIVTIILLFIVSIWGAVADNYSSFLGSRIIGGIGMAPYEVLVQATISDIYFVHERATRLAVWNLFLLCGIAGASFISGYIIEDLGYKWTFGMCAILFGLCMFAVFFLVPETSYVRPSIPVSVLVEKGSDEEIARSKKERDVHVEQIPGADEPKESFWQSMKPWTGKKYSKAPLWKIATRPFVIFFYPAVLWGFLIYGTTLTWIVVFSVVNGVIFVEPPYNFTVGETGLTGLSPFILTIIAEVISGPLNDWICVKLTKKNHGVYEPEFRLVLMSVTVILGTVGFFGFGLTVHHVTHWMGPVMTYGLANAALGFAAVAVFGYVIDSYPNLAEEAFVAINARQLLTFGLTYFVNDWMAKDGVLKVFNTLGAAFLAVCALTVPLWIFGKRIRSYIARQDWLNRFMSDTEA
ncbi:putative cycloheximide resistance protein [Botryosphaeria dothidea]|uniref:Cycloheximide resistance protein n=1 Tax=Botryosphaeria dothidea TaxID=55169 RepID=A0A8H4J4L4_9PEZI|nr:putative cycloheximide resistance protein [Botryosphaeria dothidea]